MTCRVPTVSGIRMAPTRTPFAANCAACVCVRRAGSAISLRDKEGVTSVPSCLPS
ncbi:hypothetical protein NLX83_17575 [Allokutzneria sp. A3M-2-11 16]|uniref:hypothetical protein n=1 Tax=Allokutzneria sp. A3M-2-11 16 TaxID=2962043 RepID=UPI0020B8BBF3|nr:hypothetical protein [Allokutzneria sp. A3M-2-11 16]MCP3801073.1 hypothetical protein [Allokutzneria sp. A3M-2-11 16]